MKHILCKHLQRLLALPVLLFLVGWQPAAGDDRWVTVENGGLWKDDSGREVQAHGAGFLQVGDTWYMIGEDRSRPWSPDVNMYSSKDLVHWKFERKIIENGVTHPELGHGRMIERPKLLYCARTGKYVVWCHWESSDYSASEAAVFWCDSVNGPYKYHWSGRPLGIKSRDCNVFTDDDGTAYFISTIDENRHLGLFRLSDDYLSAVECTPLFKWQSREAPAIVKVDGIYYMLSSACTGWDPNPCKLSWSRSLTEGWSELTVLGNGIAFDTQAASVLTVKGSAGVTRLYVGDRWQDPGLGESKTIVFPIAFADGHCAFDYRRRFDLNVGKGLWREPAPEAGLLHGRRWKQTERTAGQLTIDLGRRRKVGGLLVVPQAGAGLHDIMRRYELLVSDDGEHWTTAAGGEWLPYHAAVGFAPVRARYLRLVSPEGKMAALERLELFRDKD